MYFVDTNIFLRTLTGDDRSTFKNCFQFLEKIQTNEIHGVTGSLVLAEVAWTLQSFYRVTKSKIIEGVSGVLDLRGVKIVDTYNYQLALKLYDVHNIKYIDACIASIPEIHSKKWAVVSYDKDFDKLDIIRKTPKEILKK